MLHGPVLRCALLLEVEAGDEDDGGDDGEDAHDGHAHRQVRVGGGGGGRRGLPRGGQSRLCKEQCGVGGSFGP